MSILCCFALDKKLYKTVIKDIKKKNKGMFKLFNNAGNKYRKAIYQYMNRIIRDEKPPAAFALTWLIAIWKKKGSALDLNQMRYIHTKLWDAKLCEALVTRNMKGKIVKACPNIQIGGMPNSSSVEHLVTLKTWMRMLEESKGIGIINTFDMEKFFNKESLIDIMFTLSKKADISDKDYTKIAVRTSVGESKTELIKNSVGQGSFGAALASSINIGCAIQDTLKNKKNASIGHLNLNALVMQDDIAKVSTNLEDARQGCNDIYELLTRKQLSVNDTKCKYMIIGSKKTTQPGTEGP